MIRKYQRTCPFCFELCEGFEGGNLLCGCNAKYYCQFWLGRQKSEEQQDSDLNEENEENE